MQRQRVIGGEFELVLPSVRYRADCNQIRDGRFYSSGRAALYHIVLSLRIHHQSINKILIPDYICDSVIETLNIAKIEWGVYHLNDDLTINRDEFLKLDITNSAVLIVNYYGLSNIQSEIAYVKSINNKVCIIEDNVQSLYSMFEYSDSDYRFTSFRKSLPLPDGGWVLSKYLMPEPNIIENTFSQYKIAGSILKKYRTKGYYEDTLFLHLLEKGEELIYENYTANISKFTLNSLPKLYLKRLAFLRKRNAEYLVKALEDLAIRPLLNYSEEKVPLFLPIRLNNRDQIRRAMFLNHIYCPVHWPLTKVSTEDFVLGKKMAEEELSLIVDFRYTTTDLKRIIKVIKENISC